jgi:hypothetical protein
MIAVARANHGEQILSIVSRVVGLCKRKDRQKMPLWGGRSRRIISQTGS